jgi:hypothetical protein
MYIMIPPPVSTAAAVIVAYFLFGVLALRPVSQAAVQAQYGREAGRKGGKVSHLCSGLLAGYDSCPPGPPRSPSFVPFPVLLRVCMANGSRVRVNCALTGARRLLSVEVRGFVDGIVR